MNSSNSNTSDPNATNSKTSPQVNQYGAANQYPHYYLNQNYYNNWNYNYYQNYNNYYQQYQQYNSQFQNMNNIPNNLQFQNNTSPNNPAFQHRNKYNNFQKHNHNHNNSNSQKSQNDLNNYKRNFNNNNNNNMKNSKKPKIDKRDLPENNKFYCEVCDRGFKTEDKYNEHCNTHKTCGVNGCKFTAAGKLVEIHYRNFHATGIDKKVSNLQTQEEIQKYINERKKNFPTATNAENKQKFKEEKEARGVRLNTAQFGKLKSSNKKFHQKEEDKENEKDDSPQVDNIDKNNSFKKSNNRNKQKRLNKRKKNKKSLFERKAELLRIKNSKPSLLKRLLADEIRHERNILLQCVKYIVENNFFEKKTSQKDANG